MSTTLRYLAPAGAPIRAADLVAWARLAAAGDDVCELFRNAIRNRFEVRHCVLTSTGRAGLTLLLRALGRFTRSRNEVAIPSYTCFSVVAAIIRAGLRPRIIDIDPDTLDYSRERLRNADFTQVLAIIATNLYGYPNDLPAICEVAGLHGVFVIDDAAQAMGARIGGRWSGTWGDAGLFSLDKGKSVSAMSGGVVVTNSDDIASAIREELRNAARPSNAEAVAGVIKALAYWLLLRPSLYRIPNSIPWLHLGTTVFTTRFDLKPASPALVGLALQMLGHLDEFTNERRANASTLLRYLQVCSELAAVRPVGGAWPVYLRLPVLVNDASARNRLVAELTARGIGASSSYPTSIADIPNLQGTIVSETESATGARYVATRIVTLPTHPYVRAADIERAAAVIAEARKRRSAGRTTPARLPQSARKPGERIHG